MANIASAKKRAKQAVGRRARNASLKSKSRTYIKRVVAAIESGDREKALEIYRAMVPVIDSVVSKGAIHRNKAARHKSRLNSKIKAMQ